MSEKEQPKEELKEVELSEEDKVYEASILKAIEEVIGMPTKACALYKMMVVYPKGGDINDKHLHLVFIPRNHEGNAITMEFEDIAQFVIDCSMEYVKKHQKELNATKKPDRMMVS